MNETVWYSFYFFPQMKGVPNLLEEQNRRRGPATTKAMGSAPVFPLVHTKPHS